MRKLVQLFVCMVPVVLLGCGGGGSDNSSGTSTTVTAPTITTQPSSLTVTVGSSATLSVVATGTGTLAYQWSKGSTAISGATSASYTISSAQVSDSGSYTVTVTNSGGSVTSGAATLTVNTTSANCSSGTYTENVVCSVNAFLATLTTTQQATALYDSSSYTTAQLNIYKTQWSNLPNANRPGISLGSLSNSTQIAAFNAVATTALSTAGNNDFQGVLAADDYLGTMQSAYGSGTYKLAIVGTPTTTGRWTLMLGGHHMAFNITFDNSSAYPTPHHIGVEPKASFTVNGATWQVLADKASSMLAIFYGQTDSLSPTTAGSTALNSAYLTGQTFSDILIGPVEYGSGSYSAVTAAYPTSNRGVLVSSLTTAQQALVTAAITKWADDYDAATKAQLIADYTSSTAYASTYVAWGATSGAAYPNIDTDKTYMRIDGPRVWIELSCQAGVVIQNATHYHMMYRDKQYDYYNELSTN